MKHEQKPSLDQREISVKSIENWRVQLSTQNLPDTTKALYLTLLDCHQAHLSYQDRFEILSQLDRTLSSMIQGLQSNLKEKEILSSNEIHIADLINVLYIELLHGYKQVILDGTHNFFYDKKIVLSSFQRAFTVCSKIIISAFEQHRSHFPGIWFELNHLYQLAKRYRLEKKSLKNLPSNIFHLDTLEEIYKFHLLFSIANPTRMRRNQINDFFYAAQLWVPLFGLTNTFSGKMIFSINFNEDTGPKHCADSDKQDPNTYYLDLAQLILHLEQLILALNNKKQANSHLFHSSELSLSTLFINNLLNSWKTVIPRSQERKITQGATQVYLGLSACFQAISLNKSGTAFSAYKASNQDTEFIDLGNIPLPANQVENLEAKNAQHFFCQLVDESPGGYCLKWTESIPPLLQCGELIAIQTTTHGSNWSVGTIKWLKTEEDQSVLLGVQILSNRALALYARLLDAANPINIPTLLIPEQDNTHNAMTLITPAFPFKEGNEVELEYHEKSYTIKLEKSYNASMQYQEFGLRFISDQISFPEIPAKLVNQNP